VAREILSRSVTPGFHTQQTPGILRCSSDGSIPYLTCHVITIPAYFIRHNLLVIWIRYQACVVMVDG
jgi:hypothetical protein